MKSNAGVSLKIKQISFTSVFCALPVVFAAAVSAEPRKPFFESNSARDVLPTSVLISTSPGIEYFLPARPEPTSTPESELEHKVNINLQSGENKNPNTATSATVESIIAQYGDPKENFPVSPVESAPKPFKGMITAWNAGQPELAYHYARQYARYTRDLKDNNFTMTGLIGKAMEAEGMLPTNSWASSPQFSEISRLAEEQNASENEAAKLLNPAENLEISSLTPDQQALLERAKQDELNWEMRKYGELKEDPSKKPINEKLERERLRTLFRQQLPVAKDGQVDVNVFFRLSDSYSMPTVRAVQKLFWKHGNNPKISFYGFSLGMATETALFNLRFQDILFPVENGVTMARKLNVEKSPTVVFVLPGTSEVIREVGPREFYYLDEMLAVIKGRSGK